MDRFVAIWSRPAAIVLVEDRIYPSVPEFVAGRSMVDGRRYEHVFEEWEALGIRVTCEMDNQTGPVADWLPALFDPQKG
jgi:hypothetical protein